MKIKAIKSKNLLATLFILLFTLLILTTPVLAAVADTGSSTATVTFTAGNLTLDSAPNLDFGSHTITGGTQTYPATANASVVVSDLRGDGAGWHLTAALSAFQLSSSPTLGNATITLQNGTATPLNGTIGTGPNVPASVVLTSDNVAQRIATAAASTGMGTWGIDYTASNVILTVLNGTAEVGTSTATLSWVLEDAP